MCSPRSTLLSGALLAVVSVVAVVTACSAPDAAREERPDSRAPESLPIDAPTVESAPFVALALDAFVPSGFGGAGEVVVEAERIVLSQGEPLTGVTYPGQFPRVGYEIEVEAARLSGTDFFCALTLPVGEQAATVVLGGWGGSLVGLSCVDGLDASTNETKSFQSFARDTYYTLRVRVRADRIEAEFEGPPGATGSAPSKLIDLPLAGRTLSIRPEVDRCRPLGIASYNTRSAIRRVAWRPLPAR